MLSHSWPDNKWRRHLRREEAVHRSKVTPADEREPYMPTETTLAAPAFRPMAPLSPTHRGAFIWSSSNFAPPPSLSAMQALDRTGQHVQQIELERWDALSLQVWDFRERIVSSYEHTGAYVKTNKPLDGQRPCHFLG